MKGSTGIAALLRSALLVSGLLGLAACSAVDFSSPPATFDLSAARDVRSARPARAQLNVAEPAALQALDSNRILVRPSDGQVSYLPGAQWADRLPRLIQVRLVQSFENASRIASVAGTDNKLAPGIALTSEVRAFEVNAPRREAVVEISVKLVDERTGRIAAATVFQASRPVGSVAAGASASALDAALQDVLRQIVEWAVQRV